MSAGNACKPWHRPVAAQLSRIEAVKVNGAMARTLSAITNSEADDDGRFC
jgi:hypothetical protein